MRHKEMCIHFLCFCFFVSFICLFFLYIFKMGPKKLKQNSKHFVLFLFCFKICCCRVMYLCMYVCLYALCNIQLTVYTFVCVLLLFVVFFVWLIIWLFCTVLCQTIVIKEDITSKTNNECVCTYIVSTIYQCTQYMHVIHEKLHNITLNQNGSVEKEGGCWIIYCTKSLLK